MSLAPTARLAVGVAAVAAIWGGLLPALLRSPAVARHVTRMEERGVNPAAMYYTELERLPARPAWLTRHLTLWP
jgi:hypothetical protein